MEAPHSFLSTQQSGAPGELGKAGGTWHAKVCFRTDSFKVAAVTWLPKGWIFQSLDFDPNARVLRGPLFPRLVSAISSILPMAVQSSGAEYMTPCPQTNQTLGMVSCESLPG